jgi:hypothetical protein
MQKPSLQEAKEFMNLRKSGVHAYLLRSYDELREQLVTQSDEYVLRRIQGQAHLTRKLLEMIDPEDLSTNGKRG